MVFFSQCSLPIVAVMGQDISALQSGVTSLDDSVATAGKNRQAEHAEFQDLCFVWFGMS